MIKHDVIPLFPTPLYITELEGGFTNEEISFVHQTDLYSHYANQEGMCVGSDRFDIIHMPEMARIKKFVQEHLNNYSKNIMCIDNELFSTISWLNRTTKNAYHYQHNHVNSIASGTLYFTKDPAPIEFHVDKNCIWGTLKMFPTQYNQFNTYSTLVEVKQGTLVIFPPYLEHSVIRTTSNVDRISMAFNTWIDGTVGLLDKTSFLNLNNPKLDKESKDNLNVVIQNNRVRT